MAEDATAPAVADEPEVKEEVVEDNKQTDAKASQTVEISADLLERLLETLANQNQNTKNVEVTTEPTSVSLTGAGRAAGVLNKYPVDPDYYPSPVDFLMGLPTLSRFNLKENYELLWKVQGTTYETKYGTFINEPRFILTLFRKMFDDEGNLIEGKRYLIKEAFFTEDEALARTNAREMGINPDEIDFRGLMNQVRMKRFQNWMEEIFRPRANLIRPKTRKQEVIGGMVVTVEEYESEA